MHKTRRATDIFKLISAILGAFTAGLNAQQAITKAVKEAKSESGLTDKELADKLKKGRTEQMFK